VGGLGAAGVVDGVADEDEAGSGVFVSNQEQTVRCGLAIRDIFGSDERREAVV